MSDIEKVSRESLLFLSWKTENRGHPIQLPGKQLQTNKVKQYFIWRVIKLPQEAVEIWMIELKTWQDFFKEHI